MASSKLKITFYPRILERIVPRIHLGDLP